MTAAMIDSRDFIATKRRAKTEIMLPAGPKIAFKPDWTKYAKAAPFKHNDQMLAVMPISERADDYKWMAKPKKIERLRYINLMAMALQEPDEIWSAWQERYDADGNLVDWVLKRRYLKGI